jgi:hypothetical protein
VCTKDSLVPRTIISIISISVACICVVSIYRGLCYRHQVGYTWPLLHSPGIRGLIFCRADGARLVDEIGFYNVNKCTRWIAEAIS